MKYLLFFLLLALPVYSTVYHMIAKCEQDKSCSSGFRGTICGTSGFQLNRCASINQCSRPVIAPFRAYACDKDYNGDSCSAGVCYYNSQVLSCSGFQCEDDNYRQTSTCQDCVQCQSGKCLKDDDQVQCFTKDNCYFSKYTIEHKQCDSHILGSQLSCDCCFLQVTEGFDPESNKGMCIMDPNSEFQIQELKEIKNAGNEFNGFQTEQCKQLRKDLPQNKNFETIFLYSMILLVMWAMIL